MEQFTPGKIFLADQRGPTESNYARLQSTFNFGDFYDPHKQPLGSLQVFNEVSLAGLQHIQTEVYHQGYVLLLPVTGALIYDAPNLEPVIVDVGEVFIIPCIAQDLVKVTNAYDEDTILFLQIHISSTKLIPNNQLQFSSFDMQKSIDQLVTVRSQELLPLPFTFSIGMFNGRGETEYKPKPGNLIFAFIVTGAFEMQGRLLHERDALALWETSVVDIEALSNNAVMMLFELETAF